MYRIDFSLTVVNIQNDMSAFVNVNLNESNELKTHKIAMFSNVRPVSYIS